jgi:quercetin dioxygenase-like cupin family protein
MRVVRLDTLPKEPLGEATPIAGWTGGLVTRTRQTIIPDNASDDYRCSVVNFSPGATTGWHAHTCDQILVVTAGSGIVANEQEEREISVGDVVHIQAGENTGTGPRRTRHSPTSRSRRPVVRAAGDRAGSSGLHRSHHWLADEL